jgi:hypothetical protein
MRRFGILVLCGAIAGFAVGCDGGDQPNASTPPEEVNVDFAKKSADMMRSANSGMEKKNLRKQGKAKPTAEASDAESAPASEE